MNIEMIRAAAKRIDGHARRTPILSSPFLDDIAGRRVFVKAECLQHTGSFKFRGAWSAISMLSPDQIKAGVIAFSSGNHAQGIALAAQQHGAPAVIIMPANAPAIKIANTRAYGAEVVLYDRATEDRDEIGARLAAERGLTLIKPYDEPLVIAGQGTCGLEIAQELGDLSADVTVCCGGGGLTSGVAMALAADAPKMRVRPVEPVGFDDVTRSLASGQIMRNAQLDGSLCDAIIKRSLSSHPAADTHSSNCHTSPTPSFCVSRRMPIMSNQNNCSRSGCHNDPSPNSQTLVSNIVASIMARPHHKRQRLSRPCRQLLQR
mgnify:CR=1 FL=1